MIQNFLPVSRRHTRWRAPSRPSPWARSRARRSIKQLGTNGGGFFNANAAHPFENPTPLDELLVDAGDLLDPGRRSPTSGPHGEEPGARLGGLGGNVRAVLRRRDHRLLGRGAGQSRSTRRAASTWSRRRPIPAATWRARRSASASPTPRSMRRSPPTPRAARVNSDARLLHSPRRHGAAGQHSAGRGDLRRRGRGPLRHAGDGHAHGLHRRAHGRANAGVSRQEDPERGRCRWRCSTCWSSRL